MRHSLLSTRCLVLVCSLLVGPGASLAQKSEFGFEPSGQPSVGSSFTDAGGPVQVTLRPSHSTVVPGQRLTVAVEVEIDEGFWLYGPVPRGRVIPRPLVVTAEGESVVVGQPVYPEARVHSIGEGEFYDENFVYEKRAVFYVPVIVKDDAAAGQASLNLRLRGQLCIADRCLELRKEQELTFTIGTSSQADPAFEQVPTGRDAPQTASHWNSVLPQIPGERRGPERSDSPATPAAGSARPGADMTIWAALPLALLAGIALNVMPCVLPVIPLKIMSILAQARQSRRRSMTLGLAYAGGIFLFFVLVAGASVVVRQTTGALLGPNEAFKYPAAVIAMALVLVVLSLWLFNVFTISVGGRLAAGEPRSGHLGSVSSGFLTGILATPCSGPVLAAVFGWAQFQPAWLGGLAILLLGLGMAVPHAVLTAFPRLIEKLPAPGVWMEHLKLAMGFILLAVAVWLISTLGSPEWITRVSFYGVVLGLCVWMAGSWVNFNTPTVKRRAVRVVALAIAVAAGAWLLPEPPPEPIDWQAFNRVAIAKARDRDQVVLVKFTASWCGTCWLVDARVYDSEATAGELRRRGVLAIKADVTRESYPAAKMLSQDLKEPGPPVTLIYGPKLKDPIRLYGVFSPTELFEALDTAAGKG